MSPLMSLLEKETKSIPNLHGPQDVDKSASAQGCGTGHCACLKPCANCACRDKKER